MPDLANRQILLRRRPRGLVEPGDTELVTTPAPVPTDGEALVRTTYVGLDAAVRTWLNDQQGYLPPAQLGEVIRAAGIGEVVSSHCDAYEVGDVIRHRENVFEGIESCVDALNGLFTGANIGKMLVELSEPTNV